MKARHKRLGLVVVGLGGLGLAATLVFQAIGSTMAFSITPSELYANQTPKTKTFRLGGLVVENSLKREDDGLTVHFEVTDLAQSVPVTYTGILPDLFSEGQGVVAEGKLNDAGIFVAKEVLAKHDEAYMPPEAADALEKAEKAKQEAKQAKLEN